MLKIVLQQDFTLIFNNSLLINQERWSIGAPTATNYFVKFTSLGNNRYTITYRSLTYYFGSVADTRFTFSKIKQYTKKYGLTWLNEEYFNRLSTKFLLIK